MGFQHPLQDRGLDCNWLGRLFFHHRDHFGGHALAPRARVTDMMVPESVTLRARFIELRASSTYAARFRAGAIHQRALALLDRQLFFLRLINRQRRAGFEIGRTVCWPHKPAVAAAATCAAPLLVRIRHLWGRMPVSAE